MMQRALIAGALLAAASYVLVSRNPHDLRVFAGLLGLAAGASLSAVWMKQASTPDARPVVIIAALVSIAAFFLADPLALGFHGVAAITGSLCVVGLLVLLQPR